MTKPIHRSQRDNPETLQCPDTLPFFLVPFPSCFRRFSCSVLALIGSKILGAGKTASPAKFYRRIHLIRIARHRQSLFLVFGRFFRDWLAEAV